MQSIIRSGVYIRPIYVTVVHKYNNTVTDVSVFEVVARTLLKTIVLELHVLLQKKLSDINACHFGQNYRIAFQTFMFWVGSLQMLVCGYWEIVPDGYRHLRNNTLPVIKKYCWQNLGLKVPPRTAVRVTTCGALKGKMQRKRCVSGDTLCALTSL